MGEFGALRRSQVAVIGAGAIGGVMASALHEAGHEVVLCVRSPIEQLVIETSAGERRVPVDIVTRPSDVRPMRWVLLTVKSQDVEGAAPWLTALTDEGTTIVVMQNGVEHLERVQHLAPQATILPALLYLSAERLAPGRIRHSFGETAIVAAGPAGEEFSALMAHSGLKVRLEADFVTQAWRKLLLNVAANPITALTERRMEVLDDPELRHLALGLMREAAEVGAAAGASLREQDARQALETMVHDFSKGNGTSMLYDRLAGRPLEYEALNGAVVRIAERYEIDVPLNRSILALIRPIRPHRCAVPAG
jgi:2-dehydropantoate 2-reductase